MVYALRPGLSFCIRDARAYFLDVTNDRYFTLSDSLNQEFFGLLATRVQQSATDVARLIQLGLICDAEIAAPLQPFCKTVAGSEQSAEPPPPRLFLRFTLASFWRVHFSRRASLGRLKVRLRRLRSGHLANAPVSIGALCEAIRKSKYLVGDYDRCLVWSAMTADLLLRHGHDAEIVLGIATAPFRAHCWVQHGDQLVGDDIAHVRNFTPILAL